MAEGVKDKAVKRVLALAAIWLAALAEIGDVTDAERVFHPPVRAGPHSKLRSFANCREPH